MKVTNNKHNDWDLFVQSTLFAYRVSVQSSTKQTPFEMMFGVKPRLPIDVEIPTTSSNDPADDLASAVASRMVEISDQLIKTRNDGLANLAVAQDTQKRQYDAKHQGTYYDIGDLVSFAFTKCDLVFAS